MTLHPLPHRSASPLRWVPLLGVLAAGGLAVNLSGYPLLDPDEGRNADIARTMAVSGEYHLPRLNGLPYADKPALYFAAVAVSVRLFGPTELAVRLPSLGFTLATLALLVWFGNRVLGSPAGPIAALATASMPLTLAFARTVIFDAALTFFVTASIICFFLHIESPGTRRGSSWGAAAWLAISLGILTKGPIALALPLMVAVPFGWWRRRARWILDEVGMLLLVAVIATWLFSVADELPDLLHYAVVTETVARLTTDTMQRTGPPWYFFPILFAGALPWIGVLTGALSSRLERRRMVSEPPLQLFLLWIVVPLIFFSLSQSKRPQYMLPLLPAVGLWVGALWKNRSGQDPYPGARTAAAILVTVATILLFAPVAVDRLLDPADAIATAIPGTAIRLSLISLLAATVTWTMRRRAWIPIAALMLPVLSIPLVSMPLMRAIGEDRSARDLAHAITPHLGETGQVVAVGVYPLSLPFYLRREVLLATDDAAELTSNYVIRRLQRFRATPGTPLRPADWWIERLARCPTPTVFIAGASDRDAQAVLERRVPRIRQSRKYVAYGPCTTDALGRHPRRR